MRATPTCWQNTWTAAGESNSSLIRRERPVRLRRTGRCCAGILSPARQDCEGSGWATCSAVALPRPRPPRRRRLMPAGWSPSGCSVGMSADRSAWIGSVSDAATPPAASPTISPLCSRRRVRLRLGRSSRGARSRAFGSSRRASRRRPFVRLRTTALPTALETTKPTRAGCPAGASVRRAWTTTSRLPDLIPRTATEKSAERRRRWRAGSTRGPDQQSSWIRPRASRGPCGDARRGSRDRRASTSAGGSRACGRDDGCWAGRCACSRCSPYY